MSIGEHRRSFMKRITGYFFQGLLYTAPLGITIFIIYYIFRWIDQGLRDIFNFNEGVITLFSYPGMGLLVILLGVTFMGWIGPILIRTPISSFIDHLLERAPLAKIIYTSVKDLTSAFVGKEKKFDKPVLVKLDENSSVERMGFLTTEDLSSFEIQDKVAVYLPSSYGMLGDLVIVPTQNVTLLNVNPADAMKFIVSGGVVKTK